MELNKKPHHILCSVCIATYKRPELLKKLLVSLKRQKLPKNVLIEIIVVDNDIQKSAEPVIRLFKNLSNFPIFYFNQIIKNISSTRNLSVEKSAGKYILFIDDDEVAAPEWIYHHLKTIEKYNADGVIGPVFIEFDSSAAKWIQKREFFYPKIQDTGEKPEYMGTGNCCLKASVIQNLNQPFDIRYGITGGEDTHLFKRLEKEGKRFVFCREAAVTEYLPFQKTTISYLFFRGLKGGNTHTRRTIELAEKGKNFVRLIMIVKSILYGLVSLFLMIIQISNSVVRTRWLVRLGSNIGKFLAAFGWYYEGYR
jgi:succinoglycan biosynthesis protein ExoM